MCGASSAGCVVFGNDFGDSGIEISEEVVFEVARYTGKFCVVILGVMHYLVKEGEEPVANSPKGLDDARYDGLAISGRVTVKLVMLALSRSKAGLRKGCIAVPLSQRIANGGV